jgi:integrase/recombinase XerD
MSTPNGLVECAEPEPPVDTFKKKDTCTNAEVRLQPQTQEWLRGSIIEEYISDYCSHLRDRRYAESTTRVYVCCVAHFARWLTKEQSHLRARGLGKSIIERFLSYHLPVCRCPDPVRRLRKDNRAALMHLLKVLQASGTIATSRDYSSHVEIELSEFENYMKQTRGLAQRSCELRVKIIRRFLAERFGSTTVVLAEVTSTDISQFMLNDMRNWGAKSKNVIGGALRCYLQFRSLAGDEVRSLLAAIPRVANWRLDALPDVLSAAEIEELLRSFSKPFPSSKRAYAIARCLIDLGLRSNEVIQLRLDNIDWAAGTVRIAPSKSRRTDILPLPPETGRAIANYLTAERPRTANRAVFVRHKAPFDEPIKSGVVGRAVREAYQRCGWTRTRVHILRHTLASRLLRAGAPLKEIADVLRHRSVDTSAIYAKVDARRLAAVALPWPGSRS